MSESSFHRLTGSLRHVWEAGCDFVFPRSCALCGDEGPAAGEASLCESCRTPLAPAVAGYCVRCGAPTGPYLDTSDGCVHCREDRFAFERVIALGAYDGLLRSAILRAKQAWAGPLAASLVDLLWERRGPELAALAATVIVPVPQHWWHRLTRSNSAAATLAHCLARRLRVPVESHILAKRRWTPSQGSLPAGERRRNLRDAFRVSRWPMLAGETVLLVDDVLTTGTTAQRCARVLREAGAARVVVAVMARGLGQ